MCAWEHDCWHSLGLSLPAACLYARPCDALVQLQTGVHHLLSLRTHRPQVICVTIGYYASLTHAKAEGDHTGDVLFRPLGGFEAGAAALLVRRSLSWLCGHY